MEHEDIVAILDTVLLMTKEQLVDPLEKLVDCLLFELMAQRSVDYARLAGRLESLHQAMTEEERASIGGQLYSRYLLLTTALRDTPEFFLRSNSDSAEQQGKPRPDWLREVITGGRDNDNES